MHIKKKRGQSTVELVLVMTAVIFVVIAFTSSQNSGLKQQLNTTYNAVTSSVGFLGNTLSTSHGE